MEMKQTTFNMIRKMKTLFKLASVLLIVTFANNMNAQPGVDDRGEKIQQLRIAFITQKLDLSTTEAEKFWPVFNQYDKRKLAIRKELRDIGKTMKDNELGEVELIRNLEKVSALKKEEIDLNLQMARELLPVIGVQKVQMLARIEQEFRETLMNKLRERKQERMGPGERWRN